MNLYQKNNPNWNIHQFIHTSDYKCLMKICSSDTKRYYGFNILNNGKFTYIPKNKAIPLTMNSLIWKIDYGRDIKLEISQVILTNIDDKTQYMGVTKRTYYRYISEQNKQ